MTCALAGRLLGSQREAAPRASQKPRLSPAIRASVIGSVLQRIARHLGHAMQYLAQQSGTPQALHLCVTASRGGPHSRSPRPLPYHPAQARTKRGRTRLADTQRGRPRE
jgi:hypothetical protein